MSTYTLAIATEATRDLVVEALRTASTNRTRIAQGLAQAIAADKAAGVDVRSRSVRCAGILAEAGDLAVLAGTLATAGALPVVTPVKIDTLDVGVLDLDAARTIAAMRAELTGVPAEDDDGTSPEAQALAALAGLEPTDPDLIPTEDPLTAALPEDTPTTVAEVTL